ncbi:S8 family serine peptidase [Methanocella conradii]|uniref:S8 family serine peptidase n=1 Tax=Methanocella conradii TaxID=1175444 RepID=UPI0020C6C4F5|nr:S8 family serine peptidase [Methanocella conradii]
MAAVIISIILLAGAMLANAGTPAAATRANDSNTYIVVFNESNSMVSALEDQVTSFASDYNARIIYRYNAINGVAISMPRGNADSLKALKDVKYIEKDITFNVSLDKATGIMGVPQVWDLGYTGKGVKVALVDTGIDASHPDLKGRVVEWKDFVNGRNTPYDDHGHGTHCAGIIGGSGAASNGKYKGVAPEVEFIGIKVLGKDGSGNLSTIMKGLDYAARSDAQIISMSLGSDEHSQAIDDLISKAVKNGKIVVCAAGNSGPDKRTIGCPSDSPDAITVGATDKGDMIASFSSRGPTKDGRIKPDITAPGKDIISCKAAGIMNNKAIDKYYIKMSGTSMACPMVSGSIALLVQMDPKLTPQRAKEILEKTAKPEGSKCPNNDYGYGRINVKGAIDFMNGKKPVEPVKPTPGPIYPGPGTAYPGYPYPIYPTYPYPAYPGYIQYPAYSEVQA